MPKRKQIEYRQTKSDFSTKTFENLNYPLLSSELYQHISSSALPPAPPLFCRKNGLLYQGDSISWMKQLPDNFVDMIFADPPYNLKKADWDKFESQEQYITLTGRYNGLKKLPES